MLYQELSQIKKKTTNTMIENFIRHTNTLEHKWLIRKKRCQPQ